MVGSWCEIEFQGWMQGSVCRFLSLRDPAQNEYILGRATHKRSPHGFEMKCANTRPLGHPLKAETHAELDRVVLLLVRAVFFLINGNRNGRRDTSSQCGHES